MKFTYSPLNSLAIGIATLFAVRSARPLLHSELPWPLIVLVVGVATTLGVAGAALRLPRWITIPVQIAATLASLGYAASQIHPRGGWWSASLELTRMGITSVQDNTAPIPDGPGIAWLTLLMTASMVILLEIVIDALEQPAWSLAPLGVGYAMSALALPQEMEFHYFLTLVLAYGLILITTTGFHNHRASPWRERTSYLACRLLASFVALTLAGTLIVVASPAIPMGHKHSWLKTRPTQPIELDDPTVALHENLRRPTESPVLTYASSTGKPVSLRMVALTTLTAQGAHLAPMTLSQRGLAQAYQPGGQTTDVTVRVNMAAGSEYLPVPFAVNDFKAAGQWAFDKNTLSIIATGEKRQQQTHQLSYEASAQMPTPTRAELLASEAGRDPSGDETLKVPGEIDPKIVQLAQEITAKATSAGGKAIAIQKYLRQAPFTYSLQAPDATGTAAMEKFLLENHRGYCVHFAAAMVLLARIENIPARMVVGFTPGTPQGDHFLVTTHHMHAWPELYFDNLGWVPFEPTASIASPPAWTEPDANTPSPSPSPSPSPAERSPSQPAPSPSLATAPATPEAPATPSAPLPVGRILTVVVVLLLASLMPMCIRWLTRRWRLRPNQTPQQLANNAWREVRSLMLDARLPWRTGSPVVAAREMSASLHDEAAETLLEIAHIVQRTHYARGETATAELPQHVASLHKRLRKQLGRKAVYALLVPSSLAH